MALSIEDVQREATGGVYVAPERICVTADGRLTTEDDPEAVRLLVAKGGEIPVSEAAAYGLVVEAAAEAPAEDAVVGADAVDEAPADEAPKRGRK